MTPRARWHAPLSAALLAAVLAIAPATAAAQQRASFTRQAPADPDPWFGPDKALHLTASATLAGGGYALGSLGIEGATGRLALGAALALAFGVAKEGLDAAGHGSPSWKDLVWDVAGTAFGLGFAFSIDYAARPARYAPVR